MKASGKCPKCNSTDIVVDAKVVDYAHGNRQKDLTIAAFGNPEALLFKDKRATTVSAWVCAGCGFVELYADVLADIRLS